MSHSWDPERYLAYADERGRPFTDLLARVGATAPATIVDLGCGPGNLTRLLAGRWPGASVVGLDASSEMIEAAQASGDDGGIEWGVADLREWTAAEPVDVLVSNATLQWVPDHLERLPQLVEQVAPGGWFAFQVPGNFGEPSHTIRTEIAGRAPYAELTRGVAVPASHEPSDYFEALATLGMRVDAWETTYLHVLTGTDPVFTWVSGTGARPTLQALPADLRADFEVEFKQQAGRGLSGQGRPGAPVVPPDLRRGAEAMRLHHVQVACPPGGEDLARRFWAEGLGLTEVAKPEELAGRGGAWFRSPDGAEIHVGVEDPFVSAHKAHPALLLDDVAELEMTATRLGDLGFEVDRSQRETFPGFVRCHTFDGHGNRVELLARP